MATKIVEVTAQDWTELSAAEKGCFENQSGSTLLYWVAETKPASAMTKGHNLGHARHIGYQMDTSLLMKLWGRVLSGGGDVVVTEY